MKEEIKSEHTTQRSPANHNHIPTWDALRAILLCNSEGHYYIKLNTIIYCYSDNSYTTFYLSDGKKIMVSQSLKHYETVLAPYGFIRIHQSRIINLYHLLSISKTDAGHVANMTNDTALVIARQKRAKVMLMIRQNSIENYQRMDSN